MSGAYCNLCQHNLALSIWRPLLISGQPLPIKPSYILLDPNMIGRPLAGVFIQCRYTYYDHARITALGGKM